MAKRADKLLQNLLKAHDHGNLAEMTNKMARGGFLSVVTEAAPSPDILAKPVPQDVEPANKPAHDSDNEPVHKPDIYPDNKPVNWSVNDPTKQDYPAHKPVKHTANYPDNKPVKEPAKQVDIKPTHKPDNEPANKPVKLEQSESNPEIWYPFTEKQGRILLYLIKAGGITNRQHIAYDTGINIATVKHTLRILTKEGYIGQIKLYVNHTQRGFTYNVNPSLCNEYQERFKAYPANDPVKKPVSHKVKRFAGWPVNDPVKEPDKILPSSFSSSIKDLTTTEQSTPLKTILTGPEMAYWEEQGLLDKQAQKWCGEFDVEYGDMRQQLAWARWDLVNNEKEKEIQSPVNWFYGVMRKSAGCYPPPKNYQTPAEIRAARLRTQRESEQRALQELATEEIELQFKALLADPTGSEYQQLLQTVPELARGMKGKALESILRERFFTDKRAG